MVDRPGQAFDEPAAPPRQPVAVVEPDLGAQVAHRLGIPVGPGAQHPQVGVAHRRTGPIAGVRAVAHTTHRERTVPFGELAGTRIPVAVPTHIVCHLSFAAGAALYKMLTAPPEGTP